MFVLEHIYSWPFFPFSSFPPSCDHHHDASLKVLCFSSISISQVLVQLNLACSDQVLSLETNCLYLTDKVMRKETQKQTRHRSAASDIRQLSKWCSRYKAFALSIKISKLASSRKLKKALDKVTSSILGLIDWRSIQLWAAFNGSACVASWPNNI